MKAISILEKNTVGVIEDATQLVGAILIIMSEAVDIAQLFCFHPVKIITTGEGGMALTNDSLLSQKIFDLHTVSQKGNAIFAASDWSLEL